MNSRTRLLGALVVVLALGAACGDDNDTAAQGGQVKDTAPTKAEFIASADEICKVGNDQADEIFGSLFSGGEPDPAVVQESLGKVLDLSEQQIADVRALTPPKADEAQVKAMLDEAQRAASDLRAKIATPEGAMEVMSSDDDPFAAANEKLAAYGFADCAGEGEQETETFGGDELSADDQAKATKAAVKGVDFHYEGVAASYPAGPAVFSFTNDGTTGHEFGLVKANPGVTAADLVAKAKADPDDESFIERFIGAAYANPGEGTDLMANLEPGLYGFACMVENDEGIPHAQLDMIGTFTVAG